MRDYTNRELVEALEVGSTVNKIRRQNLIILLETAIRDRSRLEQELDYPADSALLAGWKRNLKGLLAGEELQIIN